MNTTIEIPEGIRFADESSEANYRKAISGELNEYGFKPLIVISASEHATGKTRLARHILEVREKSTAACRIPSNEDQWDKLISSTVESGALLLDNVRVEVTSQSLAALLTSKEWIFRKLGGHEIKTVKADMDVVITGNNVQLSEDLARRAIWIHLHNAKEDHSGTPLISPTCYPSSD